MDYNSRTNKKIFWWIKTIEGVDSTILPVLSPLEAGEKPPSPCTHLKPDLLSLEGLSACGSLKLWQNLLLAKSCELAGPGRSTLQTKIRKANRRRPEPCLQSPLQVPIPPPKVLTGKRRAMSRHWECRRRVGRVPGSLSSSRMQPAEYKFPSISSSSHCLASSDWYWLIILNLGWNFLVWAKLLAAIKGSDIYFSWG